LTTFIDHRRQNLQFATDVCNWYYKHPSLPANSTFSPGVVKRFAFCACDASAISIGLAKKGAQQFLLSPRMIMNAMIRNFLTYNHRDMHHPTEVLPCRGSARVNPDLAPSSVRS